MVMYIIPNFQDFFETKMITYNIEGGGFSNLMPYLQYEVGI